MSDNRTDDNDLKSALLGAVAEVEEKTPGSTGRLAEVQPKAPIEKPAVEATEKTPGVREKDPLTGQFKPLKTEKPVQAADKAPAEQTKAPAKSGEVAGTEAKAIDPAQAGAAPAQWKAEAKAAYEKLDPEIRKVISGELARRETEFSKGIEAKANELKQAQNQLGEIEPHLGPRRAALVANYGSVGAAMKRLFDLSDFASSDAPGFIAWFSQQTGTDLQALLQGQPAARQAAPEVVQLQQTIQGLTSRLQAFEGNTQQTQMRSFESEFDALEAEKDADGNVARPFWGDLRSSGTLGQEIANVRQEHPEWSAGQVGKQAYENAVWKHSDTRTQLLTQREAKVIADREAKERADKASNARKFTAGSSPNRNAGEAVPKNSLRDELSEQVYAAMGGATRL